MRAEIEKEISENRYPDGFRLVNLKISDDEIREIMGRVKAIKPQTSIIVLDSNEITDKGASILSECLHDFHELTELSVQFNEIGRDGALALFSLKKMSPGLRILFHGNKIIDVGEMSEIASLAIGSGPSLKKL